MYVERNARYNSDKDAHALFWLVLVRDGCIGGCGARGDDGVNGL